MSNILNLPELDFGIESTTTILNRLIKTHKDKFGESLSPADPVYVFYSGVA